MIKKIDGYIIKTFFGPFFFIFSVLFFIFIVQFAWNFLDRFTGKGLGLIDIAKLLFYWGLTIIQLVLPLTILLSSIMTFGGLGERYELAAMKSSGLSLYRIMMPLFFLVLLMSIGLFFFSDKMVPDNQKKAKNMMFNIVQTRPALNFVSGQFITSIPGFTLKVDNKTGEYGEKLEKVFIHRLANNGINDQTIIAEKGIIVPTKDKFYLELSLFNGFIYENEVNTIDFTQRAKYPNTSIKFDTLKTFFDISELIKQGLEKEKVTDNYKFDNYEQLTPRIDSVIKADKKIFTSYGEMSYNLVVNNSNIFTDKNLKQKTTIPFDIEKISNEKKIQIGQAALTAIAQNKKDVTIRQDDIQDRIKYQAKMIIFQQRIISYSITCIIFFLIGAPLGAIIRKGGVGMPVVVAVLIFMIFYIIFIYTENLAKGGLLNPYIASWIPNLLLLPLGIFLTYKAMMDSEIFNLNQYLEPIQKLITINKNKIEHKRYQ